MMRLSGPSAISHAGFTLAEISIALGIVAIAVIAMLGAAGGAIRSSRSAMDSQVASQVAQRIVNEMQLTDFDTMIDLRSLPTSVPEHFSFRAPSVSAPRLRYFDQLGLEIVPTNPTGKLSKDERRRVLFYVLSRIAPRVGAPRSSERNGLPIVTAPKGYSMALVTIEVARSVRQEDPEIEPGSKSTAQRPFDGNRFTEDPGVAIYRHTARIARTY